MGIHAVVSKQTNRAFPPPEKSLWYSEGINIIIAGVTECLRSLAVDPGQS